ncbi:MAG: AraC family transcriptional regulator, partial [Clostridiales bacterium]|nr:AraC family transcriptional regulator [Clostridiales bacterium]
NKLKLYRFVHLSSGNQPRNYEKFAFTTLADNYVITDDGTCGVRFFCSQFGLTDAALAEIARSFDESPQDLATFTTAAAPDGEPLYIHVRREKFGSSFPLYIFTSFREWQLFETGRLSDGTFAIYRNGVPVAAVGEYTAGELGGLAVGAAPKGYARLDAASDVGGYRYVYLARIPSPATPVVFWLAFCGALMLAGDVLLMLVIAKKMYMPIRELVGAAGRSADGPDEFSYIKKTILALHGKLRTMELSERQYHATLDNIFYRDLLEGRAAGERAADWAGAGAAESGGMESAGKAVAELEGAEAAEAAELEELVDLVPVPATATAQMTVPALSVYASAPASFAQLPPLPGGARYHIAVIRYNQSDNADVDMPQDTVYFWKQTMDEFLADALRGLPFARIIDMSFDTQAILLACGRISAFEDALNESLLSVEADHGLSLAAAISRAFLDMGEAASAYRQAAWLLETGGAGIGGQKVLSFREEPHGGSKNAYFPVSVENSLASALFQGKTGLWRGILADVIAENRARGSEAGFRQLSFMMATATERLLDAAGLSAPDIFGGEDASVYLEYRMAEDYDALGAKAAAIFEAVGERVLAAREKLSPAAEESMARYVDENYRKDISLYDLAAHLGLSKNYVSALFKNATGMNFKEYVSRVRYREACAIFDAKPGVKVKDVAAMIGCSTDILIRLFLKYSGAAPKDYQRRAAQGVETAVGAGAGMLAGAGTVAGAAVGASAVAGAGAAVGGHAMEKNGGGGG